MVRCLRHVSFGPRANALLADPERSAAVELAMNFHRAAFSLSVPRVSVRPCVVCETPHLDRVVVCLLEFENLVPDSVPGVERTVQTGSGVDLAAIVNDVLDPTLAPRRLACSLELRAGIPFK